MEEMLVRRSGFGGPMHEALVFPYIGSGVSRLQLPPPRTYRHDPSPLYPGIARRGSGTQGICGLYCTGCTYIGI